MDLCFFQLETPRTHYEKVDKHKEILETEKFQEKLNLFISILKLMTDDHVKLLKRILDKSDKLVEAVVRIFIQADQEASTTVMSALEIVELISKQFMANCVAKNLYEYPIQAFIKVRDHLLNGVE